MSFTVRQATHEDIQGMREQYRQEMSCQVIHDSIHSRPGWTLEYLIEAGGVAVGYGSVAIAGPWKGKPTIYEFHVLPYWRQRAFDFFAALVTASGAVMIETQTNDQQLTVMLHTFGRNIENESILFEDGLRTMHPANGAIFRPTTSDDLRRFEANQLQMGTDWIVEADGQFAGKGGILFHYNRPYGDIYMEIAELFRRRGFGAYLVQELKRVCYERGNVPAARCNPKNVASRKTLQKAGFVPCGNILNASISRD